MVQSPVLPSPQTAENKLVSDSASTRLSKIVATLGPDSSTEERLRQFIETGVSVFRINFSHSHLEELTAMVNRIKAVRKAMNRPVAILGDLQGPKFRTGWLKDGEPFELVDEESVKFSASLDPGEPGHIRCEHPVLVKSLEVGHRILIDDGAIALMIKERVSDETLICEVEQGGLLKERKGINFPDMKMEITTISKKDEEDCRFALDHDFDFLAISFVQTYEDVDRVREFVQEHLPEGQKPPLIISKIERPQAVEGIHRILESSDGIMVARGDMGVELQPERVPAIQKMLIEKANRMEKPVITATQMLESMIEEPVPTRAEVSDVANAVLDGSDALMLSAESAVGKYPIKAVNMMARIIAETERNRERMQSPTLDGLILNELYSQGQLAFHESIARCATMASGFAGAKAIVALSFSGKMAKRLSKGKPSVPIIAMSPDPKVVYQLNLLRGVYPILIDAPQSSDEALLKFEDVIQQTYSILKIGDPIVFCAGTTNLTGLSNVLKIFRFGDAHLYSSKAKAGEISLPSVK